VEVFRTAVSLMVRSMVLSAQSAGQQRLLWLQQSAAVGRDVGEVARLREENRWLKSENRLLKARFGDVSCSQALHPDATAPSVMAHGLLRHPPKPGN